jgi:hypothetical protein
MLCLPELVGSALSEQLCRPEAMRVIEAWHAFPAGSFGGRRQDCRATSYARDLGIHMARVVANARTERHGRPRVSAAATGAARPRSLQ